MLLKKTLLHEQNAVLGRANRFLISFVKGVATSFFQTKHASNSAVWIGNPVRESVHVAMADRPTKNSDQFHICIVGGSQGAKGINEIFDADYEESLEKISQMIFKFNYENLSELVKYAEYYNNFTKSLLIKILQAKDKSQIPSLEKLKNSISKFSKYRED